MSAPASAVIPSSLSVEENKIIEGLADLSLQQGEMNGRSITVAQGAPTTSLIASMIPSQGLAESSLVNRETSIPGYGNVKLYQEQYNLNLRLAKIFLVVAQETAQALLDSDLKKFDALVRNFGCQVTALEVYQLAKKQALRDEAVLLKAAVESSLMQLGKCAKKPPHGKNGHTLTDYLVQSVKIDVLISPQMARLVRHHLLCIVNDCKAKEGVEIPITNVDLLLGKLTHKKITPGIIHKVVGRIIAGIQVEESRVAANFIRTEAALLPAQANRTALINRMLVSGLQRSTKVLDSYEQTPIVSIPLLYNTEAVFRRVEGIVLVKNKLLFCKQPIANALPQKVFIRMPQEQILSAEEVAALDSKEPVIVVEGYVKNEIPLAEKIRQLGLITIINANTARISQYASGTSDDKIEDQEARADIAKYATCDAAIQAINIDHIYCGSIKEER